MTDRHEWVLETLDVRPDDELLEIGCGGGVAAALVCERLQGGAITAIDRSSTQIERATRRNAEHVASGKARLLERSLEALELPNGTFDKVFAASVNLFWVRPARAELELIARLLRQNGRLFLFYEAFTEASAEELEASLVRNLTDAGFTATPIRAGRRLAISARTSAPS